MHANAYYRNYGELCTRDEWLVLIPLLLRGVNTVKGGSGSEWTSDSDS